MPGLFDSDKKEVLSVKEIEGKLKGVEELKDKISFLKGFLVDAEYADKRKDIVRLLGPLLLDSKNSVAEYRLAYDSISEGLEPIYFWVLDFMRDNAPGGLGLDVKKGPEVFEASVSSGYFGEMGQRTSLMQQKVMEYLGTVNNLIKSILNLIYDLNEFKIKLAPYNDTKDKSFSDEKKRAAMHSLKGIWMDQVDSRKGRGSINLLAQDLAFVTLRDAFFYISTPEEIAKVDLNERVKNILRRKLEEFNSWLKYSEEEIRKRYEIEKIYLKSQVGTLKLYTSWIKPYLIAAQKLKMGGNDPKKDFMNPDIVNSFSNMQMDIKLYGKAEVKPSSVHGTYAEIELDTKYFIVVEVDLKFRSVPSVMSGQGGRQYVHGGRTDIIFRGFVMDNTEVEARESMELYEDINLIEQYVGVSLEKLQVEIDGYLKEEPKEEKKPEKKNVSLDNPFGDLYSGVKYIFSPIKGMIFTKKQPYRFLYKEVEAAAKSEAELKTFLIYNVYKKAHGMINV